MPARAGIWDSVLWVSSSLSKMLTSGRGFEPMLPPETDDIVTILRQKLRVYSAQHIELKENLWIQV
jgi:hypothetical protein